MVSWAERKSRCFVSGFAKKSPPKSRPKRPSRTATGAARPRSRLLEPGGGGRFSEGRPALFLDDRKHIKKPKNHENIP